jgi:large subunit ribosomal protein L23
MALFGSKKKTETKKTEKKVTEKAVAVRDASNASAVNAPMREVILRPRITEKSGIANEAFNIYTFEVAKNATKRTVAQAVKAAYKVTPVKVRTITLPGKSVFVRGRFGTQSSVKKALVYLKKGDKIEVA